MRHITAYGCRPKVSRSFRKAKEVKSAMRKSKLTQEDRAIRMMLAFLCVATEAEASLLRKVQILDKFELSDLEIAKVCGCTTQSVANARAMRKKLHLQ